MKPRSLDAVDIELALAIRDLERTVERLPHGRVILTVERLGRVTIGHEIAVSRETSGDVERVMQEVPSGRKDG